MIIGGGNENVQILEETVSISHNVNTVRKGMYPTVLLLYMDK